MNLMDAFDRCAMFFAGNQVVFHMNSPDHQHVTFSFDFASNFSDEFLITTVDIARLQRTAEGSS